MSAQLPRPLSTAAAILVSYIAVSLVGAALLLVPACNRGGLSMLDALFTSVSAVCVTGLVVVDTPTAFTPAGKCVLMLLIQVGGLGYMTIAAVIIALIGSRGSLYVRRITVASLGAATQGEVIRVAARIAVAACIIELIFIAPLFLGFSGTYGTREALWHALFHSVSAFNNAGFSTFSASLIEHRANVVINLSVIALVIIGGIGFRIWRDVKARVLRGRPLDTNARLVLITTAILIIFPWAFMYFFEQTLEPLERGERVLASLFASVTPRTAGFNTIDYHGMSIFGKLLTMTLMFIGGSPGGTAGGIKTATAAIVAIWTISTLRGRLHISIFKRTLGDDIVTRAFQGTVIAVFVAWFVLMAITVIERDSVRGAGLEGVAFEVMSAFGTVGLSTGSLKTPFVSLTADFSAAGKMLIMAAMIVGRAGYLIFAASLISPTRRNYEYAKAEVML